jgi:hypothetical protein
MEKARPENECPNCGVKDQAYAEEEECVIAWICGDCGWYH